MSSRKKVYEVEVTQRHVVPSDPELLAEATRRWQRSMTILFELQDQFEANLEVDQVSQLQNTSES